MMGRSASDVFVVELNTLYIFKVLPNCREIYYVLHWRLYNCVCARFVLLAIRSVQEGFAGSAFSMLMEFSVRSSSRVEFCLWYSERNCIPLIQYFAPFPKCVYGMCVT